MLPLQLTFEESYLLDRAKEKGGYVATDRRDDYDVVSDAYQAWCRETQVPFLEVAMGDATSRVTYSLLAADDRFEGETERLLR